MTGKYFEKCRVSKPAAFCEDDESAKRLWELSEKLVATVGAATQAA